MTDSEMQAIDMVRQAQREARAIFENLRRIEKSLPLEAIPYVERRKDGAAETLATGAKMTGQRAAGRAELPAEDG